MDHAYTTAGWENFYFAEVGASAALVGLLFVAVSINLTKIIAVKTLPTRATEALMLFVDVLFIGTFALVPGQSTEVLGVEILAMGIMSWLVCITTQVVGGALPGLARRWFILRVVSTQLATVPMIIAGASLFTGSGGGLYWTVPGVIASFLAAIYDAWVLLVEIHR